jgi:FlaA1/EpsC-like NDP-sugar epimerase
MTTPLIHRVWIRRLGILGLDAVLLCVALTASFWLRFDATLPARMIPVLLTGFLATCAAKLPVFVFFHVDRLSWKHVSVRDMAAVGVACTAGSAVFALAILGLRELSVIDTFPRSVFGIDLALSLLAVGGLPFSRRAAEELLGRHGGAPGGGEQRALVVGAGDAGAQLLRALERERVLPYVVVGFLDDDLHKQGAVLRGVPVLGPRAHLSHFAARLRATAVLIAMPSAPRATVRETVALAHQSGIEDIRILPGLGELYSGQITVSELRRLEPADVLQREEVEIDPEPIQRFLGGASVLVTGAAGSIGSELCRQILRFGASRLTALDFDETGLFDLEAGIRSRFPAANFSVVVGDVRDGKQMLSVLERERPSVVYHAAAYKHVPMMESYPCEAVKTNVEGTRNVLAAARAAACETFVLISTDKAVNPSSVMGVSKRVAEMLLRDGDAARTRAVAVRFGNVLGSRGSVLRTFQMQVESRQPVTVTHPEMERYFMITAEAVQLVLQASVIGQAGQVLVLDMGKRIKIVDLARDVIRFYGLEPDVDIPIVFSGTRPGEKLYEELLTAEDGTDKTSHPRLFVARLRRTAEEWDTDLEKLLSAARDNDARAVLKGLQRLVPTYRTPSP